jgi:hypothetical protein
MAVIASVTGLNVAQPEFAVDFNASQSEVMWFINLYTLSLAALLLPLGALGDRWGRKPMLLAGLTVRSIERCRRTGRPTTPLCLRRSATQQFQSASPDSGGSRGDRSRCATPVPSHAVAPQQARLANTNACLPACLPAWVLVLVRCCSPARAGSAYARLGKPLTSRLGKPLTSMPTVCTSRAAIDVDAVFLGRRVGERHFPSPPASIAGGMPQRAL